MPTALRFDGLRVVIYPNDHRPAHVHVIGHGKEAVLDLNCPLRPPGIRENYRFSNRELNSIFTFLITSIAELCHAWKQIHDRP